MKKVAVLLLCALLGACATIKEPRIPDDSARVPINRTVPPEVQNGVVN